MGDLYDGMTEKSEKVATFLAILELTKSGRIFLNDDNSKIFFNKASKNKKVESDFDKPVVIESETTEAVPEPEPGADLLTLHEELNLSNTLNQYTITYVLLRLKASHCPFFTAPLSSPD